MFASIVNIFLTVAIAAFTCLTWWATRTYARMAALSLLLQKVKDVVDASENANRQADIQSIKLIKKDFPDLYNHIKVALGTETQKQIEDY